MNVNQMVSHLIQVGTMPFEASLPDKSNFLTRRVIRPLAFYVLPMPKEVKTSPELDQTEQGRKPGNFEEDKRLLLEYLNRLAELQPDAACEYHPFFGKMSAKDWQLMAYKHTDHHLRQFGV
jgi:hypothetical protein